MTVDLRIIGKEDPDARNSRVAALANAANRVGLLSVCLSVCLSGLTAETIEMPFGMVGWVDPKINSVR